MAYLDENGLEHFWGKIKDHVSSAVAPKANDADVVHKTGDETVEGVKTFSNTYTHANGSKSSNLSIQDPEIVKGTAPETKHYSSLVFTDSEGEVLDNHGRLAVIEYQSPSESKPNSEITLAAYSFVPASDSESKRWTGFTTGFDGNLVPFATAPETSDDRTDSADIVTRGFMEASEWNWQKTKKAGAVAFKPVPESDLEPVVDFMFMETPPAEGEKGPDNPSTITGVTQAKVTRCGKNIISYPFYESSDPVTKNDVTFTPNSDGSLTVNGTASGNTFYTVFSKAGSMQIGQTYTLSGCPSGGSVDTYLMRFGTRSDSCDFGNGFTRTLTGNDQSVVIRINSGYVASNLVFKPQLELSSTVTAFESYAGNDYTIQLGDTYYGGSLDVATGVMTATWAGETIANFDAVVDKYTNTISFMAYTVKGHFGSSLSVGRLVCDSFVTESSNSDNEHCRFSGDSTQARYATYFFILKSRLDVSGAVNPSSPTDAEWLAAANAWLVSNPVFVCYQLFASKTVQLTPTQIRSLPALDKYEPRINTVYTDQEAVQVGYQRFANYVDLTTDQTIAGSKVFTSTVTYEGGHNTAFQVKIPAIERGNVTTSVYRMPFFVSDKNDRRAGGLYEEFLSSGEHTFSLMAYDSTTINNTYNYLRVGFDADHNAFAYTALTSFKRDNGHDIVTRNYVTINNVYVDAVNGSDSNEGTSAATAFKTINAALSKISYRNRCTVHITAGTYTENITIANGLFFEFYITGNVVINGSITITRNASLLITTSSNTYTFTVKSLTIAYCSLLFCDTKIIVNNTYVSCYDESEAVFNRGLEVIVNSGNSQYGVYANTQAYVYITNELTIRAGSVTGSAVSYALYANRNSSIYVTNCVSNITCTSDILRSDYNSFIQLYNSSYSDSNNVFTGTTSGRTAISVMAGVINSSNVKMAITTTRDENHGSHVLVNLNDNSSFSCANSQLNINCTGKAHTFLCVFGNSNFVLQSGSLVLNGAVYSCTVRCYNNSLCYIGNNVTVSGTVTGGQRFWVNRGGQIDIGGHSAGLNRIPGGSAGNAESSSYGYYG